MEGQQIHDAIYGEMRKTTIEGMQQLPLGFDRRSSMPVTRLVGESRLRSSLMRTGRGSAVRLRCGSIIGAVVFRSACKGRSANNPDDDLYEDGTMNCSKRGRDPRTKATVHGVCKLPG